MIVLDSSAALASLAAGPQLAAVAARIAGEDLAAPHVVDLEVHHALRGMLRRRELTAERAERIRADYLGLAIDRYPHEPLLDRVWELRGHLTAYDAVFVALAEALEAPLVTTDDRLARAGGHHAVVESLA